LCHNSTGSSPSQYNDLTNSTFTEHLNHVNDFLGGIACAVCHDPALLTPLRHFGGLTDNTFPAGAARATIYSSLLWNPAPPITKSSCSGGTASSCHQ
jgi:putative intracellular protease/amidase